MDMGLIWIIAEAILNLAVASYVYPRLWSELSKEGLQKNGRILTAPATAIWLGALTIPSLYSDGTVEQKIILGCYLWSLQFLGFAWAMRARADARPS